MNRRHVFLLRDRLLVSRTLGCSIVAVVTSSSDCWPNSHDAAIRFPCYGYRHSGIETRF